MSYCIHPEQAKELLDKLKAVQEQESKFDIPLYSIKARAVKFEVGLEVLGDRGGLKCYDLSDKVMEHFGYEPLFVRVEWELADSYHLKYSLEVSLNPLLPGTVAVLSKQRNRRSFVRKLENAYNLGISLYLEGEEQKLLQDILEPIREEYLEKVVKEEESRHVLTRKEVEDYIKTLLAEDKTSQKTEEGKAPQKTEKAEDREAEIIPPQYYDIFPVENSEKCSPVSCFTLGAIGAFIVFAVAFLVSNVV